MMLAAALLALPHPDARALSIETRIAITTTITERTTQEDTGPRVQGTDFVTVKDTVTEVAVTFEERGG